MKSIVLALLFLSSFAYSQEAVELLESSLEISGSEVKEFYFGFAAGDQIVLDIEVKGKSLIEVEVAPYQSGTLFSNVETKKLRHKTFPVSRNGIYQFRLTNKGLTEKECTIHIQRIPANEKTQAFNSTVYWETISDTISKERTEKYLVKKDTSIIDLLNEVSKVHSYTNFSSNKNITKFKLPKNTVSWAYYIDVNQAGQKDFEKATKDLARLAPAVSRIPEIGPVAALALGMAPLLPAIQTGEDVDFYLTDYDNSLLFLDGSSFSSIRKGRVINTYGKMEPDPNYNGYYYVCLENDNAVTAISVMVKVVAITVTEEWQSRVVKAVVKERKEGYLRD